MLTMERNEINALNKLAFSAKPAIKSKFTFISSRSASRVSESFHFQVEILTIQTVADKIKKKKTSGFTTIV